jgi:hypothetical protein
MARVPTVHSPVLSVLPYPKVIGPGMVEAYALPIVVGVLSPGMRLINQFVLGRAEDERASRISRAEDNMWLRQRM